MKKWLEKLINKKEVGIQKVGMIGAGNLSWHLSQALESVGLVVTEVYSRDINNAKKLCKKLYDATPTDLLDFRESEAELFFVSIPDDTIISVANSILLPHDAIIVHTSGATSIEVLVSHQKFGVFYPLQTFSIQQQVRFKNIPLCLEASDGNTLEQLEMIGNKLSNTVERVSTQQRKVIHLAAVFACNFSNHFMAISELILNAEKQSFEILKPLIEATLEKALKNGPATSQTGPAIRGDQETINEHLALLKNNAPYNKLYTLITRSIIDFYEE